MNNLSKLIIFLVLCLAIWWGYDNFLGGKVKIPEIPKKEITTEPKKEEPPEVTEPDEQKKQDTEDETYIYVYMLTADKNGGQFLKPVKRPLPPGKDKLNYAVTTLLSGPNNMETTKGIYSEIPANTRLLNITTADDRVTINLTGSFGTGGGSDSTYSRMRQLIKTVLANSDKPVYLQLDGKQADIIGGEGITVTQPLSEKSLDE